MKIQWKRYIIPIAYNPILFFITAIGPLGILRLSNSFNTVMISSVQGPTVWSTVARNALTCISDVFIYLHVYYIYVKFSSTIIFIYLFFYGLPLKYNRTSPGMIGELNNLSLENAFLTSLTRAKPQFFFSLTTIYSNSNKLDNVLLAAWL